MFGYKCVVACADVLGLVVCYCAFVWVALCAYVMLGCFGLLC